MKVLNLNVVILHVRIKDKMHSIELQYYSTTNPLTATEPVGGTYSCKRVSELKDF